MTENKTRNNYDGNKSTRRFSIHPHHRRGSIFPAEDANVVNINSLPDKLLHKTFTFLSVRDLCIIARVCKNWRIVSQDPSLWNSLNFRPEYGGISIASPETMLQVISTRSGGHLRYIELGSDLITIQVLEDLANRRPNLRYLTLDFSNAMQLHDFNDLMGFPASLYYLCICLSDVIFMEGLMRKIYPCLSSLEVLHLIGTFERSNDEEEEIYEVINISKIKTHTPNLRVINLFGITFVDDTHVELLSQCIHLQCISVNYCLKVKGASLRLLIQKCKKLKSLLMQHCDLQDENMRNVMWEDSQLEELDISSTELSSSCLEEILLRMPPLCYLALSYCDFFTDKILDLMMKRERFVNMRCIDMSNCLSLSEDAVLQFCLKHGRQLHGLMLKGNHCLAEYFWIRVIPKLKVIRTCAIGTPNNWFFRYNTRIHIDQVVDAFAQNCPFLESVEVQWDPDTIRFSDKSRKFIDHIRLKCPRLRSFTLSDGKYYEMVRSNFERADRFQVVRTTTTYESTLANLLMFYTDLQFN